MMKELIIKTSKSTWRKIIHSKECQNLRTSWNAYIAVQFLRLAITKFIKMKQDLNLFAAQTRQNATEL